MYNCTTDNESAVGAWSLKEQPFFCTVDILRSSVELPIFYTFPLIVLRRTNTFIRYILLTAGYEAICSSRKPNVAINLQMKFGSLNPGSVSYFSVISSSCWPAILSLSELPACLACRFPPSREHRILPNRIRGLRKQPGEAGR